MGDRLFSLRGLEPGEKHLVSMLLVQALFLGIFIGAFDISAHSLFLAIFDEKILAKGYIASGIAGIILLFLHFYFQSRIKSGSFELLNMIVIAAITFLLWIALSVSPSAIVTFMVFVFVGPLNILAVMGFRSIARNMFTHVKGRRLYPVVDSALIIGIIISCYAIPVLMYIDFRLPDVLLICMFSIIASAIALRFAAGSLKGSYLNPENHTQGFKSSLSALNIFRKDPYSRHMGIFIILSVVSALFIQYSFLAVTREKFPAGENMAEFLGIFTGTIMIFTLLGKVLLFSYLLSNYGLRVCLTITPILLIIITIIAVILGMAMGYTMETSVGFMIFFIMLALIRFLSKSMDDSIESPSFRLLYQTIDEKLRVGVQSVMDNAVKEAGAFLAGVILAGIGVLGFIRLIHFSFILIIVLLIWLYIAFRLYNEYKESVRKGLESLKSREISPEVIVKPSVYLSRYYGERAFRLDYFNLISGDYSFFEKTDNEFYFKKIIDHTFTRRDAGLLPLIRKIAAKPFDEEARQKAADILKNLNEISAEPKRVDEKISSAKRVLSGTRMPQTTEILRLLRDKSPESKRLAIYLIGKFRLTDMLPDVCECLNIPGLEIDASEVLRAFGSNAEEELIRFYLVSSGNINTGKTVLRILSGLNLDEGMGFLFSRLWSNSRQLKEVALKCLIDCRFSPSDEDKERLNALISDIIGVITWNLSAKRCLETNNDTILLNEMNKELNRWSSFLINILSITYNAAAVTRIRKNLEFETLESVHFAHAIIDIIVDDSIKAKIIYLLDVVPDDEKLENLKRFFPVEIPDYHKLIEDILNRDYNLLGIWTKACALRYLSEIRDNEMSESVIALLFSPENILQEEAVRLIARSDVKLYRSVYNRIPLAARKRLDKIIGPDSDSRELLFEKILFLTGCFQGILEDELLYLARNVTFTGDLKAFSTFAPDGYIQWTLESGSSTPSASFFYSSDNKHTDLKDKMPGKAFFYILSFKALEEFLYQFPDNGDIIFKYFEENES